MALELEEKQVQLDIADISKWASPSEYLDGRANWGYDSDEEDEWEFNCSRLSNTTLANSTSGKFAMPALNVSSVPGHDNICGRIPGSRAYNSGRRPVVRVRPLAIGARIPPPPNFYHVIR